MENNINKSENVEGNINIRKEQAKQRIDEYNSNQNYCKKCGKPIIAPYGKKLRDTKNKKFCSRTCFAQFNNIGKAHNPQGKNNSKSIIDNLTDQEIIDAFTGSSNLSEFSIKLGYKTKIHKDAHSIQTRLSKLDLDINELLPQKTDISTITKKDLFAKHSNWQCARYIIQKEARKIYQNSEKSKQCIVCGYNKHYEVAHIKAVSNFDDKSLICEINSESNLIALCPNHHWEYDNNILDISRYII